jgi:hypothetical protein
VVAYGVGGSLETVRGTGDSPTGVYFEQQTVESLMEGILRFEAASAEGKFHSDANQQWAAQFSTQVFLRRMRAFVLEKMPDAAEIISPETNDTAV